MSELKNRYFDVLNLPSGESSGSREKALSRAYELRTFEIEHYWKRATYFWGFQVAIFAAFGFIWKEAALNTWSPIALALAGLGVVTAVANSLSARGSKFWQENWEKHIDMLEDDVEGRLFKTIWLDDGRVSYSVSRLNKVLSTCFVIFWVFVTANVVWNYVKSILGCSTYLSSNSTLIVVFAVFVIGSIAALFRQKTRLRGVGANARCCFWRKRNSEPFVRRLAPGEKDGDSSAISTLLEGLAEIVDPNQRESFVIFGSAAIVLRGKVLPRVPKDLDVFVSDETFNRLHAVLDEKSMEGTDGSVPYFSRDVANMKIEIFKTFQGVHFEDVRKNAKVTKASLGFPVGSIEDLIRWKKTRGKPKDLDDLKAMEERSE